MTRCYGPRGVTHFFFYSRDLPEVKMQQHIARWKAESLRNSISKELAPEEASIESHGDFESDRSAVGRLRRRAFGGIH